jgi:hypothetical protein
VIWSGARRAECLDYYGAELTGCNDSCAKENNYCRQDCDAYGDPACSDQCDGNAKLCRDSCAEDYDQEVLTCPAF